MEKTNWPCRQMTDNQYMACRRIIEGRPFEDVKALPEEDSRFTYGASKGEDNLVDLNFMDILVTVKCDNKGKACLSEDYEAYGAAGSTEMRKPLLTFLDFVGYLMTGDVSYNNCIVASARKWVGDGPYTTRTFRLHDGVLVDYNDYAIRLVDKTDRCVLIRDRWDFSEMPLREALEYAKAAYKEYVEFVEQGPDAEVMVRFSEDGVRDKLPDSRHKRLYAPAEIGWPYRMVYAVPVTKTYSVEFVSLEKAEEFRDKFVWAFKDFHNDIFDIE